MSDTKGDEKLIYDGNAQFIVSKEAILKNTISFYQTLYDKVMNNIFDGAMFEECWHIIFTQNQVYLPIGGRFNYEFKYTFDIGLSNSKLCEYVMSQLIR